ncbi:MAG: hypothetical protein IKX26_08930 [Bacteroidales bacterium]|nr:hypothetical protein [Bacteroidales bacterium]
MKRHFITLILFSVLCLFCAESCKFINKGEKDAHDDEYSEAQVEIDDDAIEIDCGDDGLAVLGKIAVALDKLGKKAVENGWIDTSKKEKVAVQTVEEEENPKPKEPDAWYGKDFSVTVEYKMYVNYSKRVPEGDKTFLITRVGNKAWIRTQKQGITQDVKVFEYADGGTTEKIYKGGKLTWTSPPAEISLGGTLAQRLVSGKEFAIAGNNTKVNTAGAKEITYCGRPCLIVTKEIDSLVSGISLHINQTLYLDKEYGFAYKNIAKGSASNGMKIDMSPLEVTSFTDKPTQKDVPSINTENPRAALKKKALKAAGLK